ncbi:MAG: DUF87 domain-containing protein [Nanoarchaeota archaeon]|nr:DUF87 domain-containing protein [Nanoarchaeota archaeon]
MPFDVIVGRNESDKKAFGKRGLAYLGKTYVTMGNYTSLSNPIYMDVARSHVVLISGKRGCLTGDTMIFTDKGYREIKEFNEKEDKVLSFNKQTKEFEWEGAELLSYPIKNEDLFKIELDDGRIINLTNEHPLLSSYGKYLFYRRACDLKVNDKIVLPIILPEIKKDEESLRIARLLGFILSDGTINIRKGRFKDGRGAWYNGTRARIRINNACDEVLNLAKEDFEKEFNIVAKRYERNDCNCEIVETKHQKVVNKFVGLGVPVGLKSHKIRIPEVVFKSSNKFKMEFISALFDCNGFICKNSHTIDYSSKSRKFLEDLQILLTHFQIESVIRIKNAKLNGKVFENYRLFITDNHSIENFKKIGFHSKFKQERLDKHKSNGTKRRKTHYPAKNLVCKKIKSIEKLSGVRNVYDLSVDKNHSFIANGLISHNSGKSYTIGTMAEALSNLGVEESGNIAPLIFDTMGIFWTMKYKNEKDRELLDEWGLVAKNIPLKVFAPFGYYQEYRDKGIEVDAEFAIKISELEPADWVTLFELKFTDPIAVVIESVVTELKESEKSYSFEKIYDLISRAENVSQEVKNSAMALFDAAKTWKVFDEEKGTTVRDLITAGETTVIDLSMYASLGAFNVRAMIIGLVSKKIFNERMSSRKDEEIQAVQHGANYMRYQVVRDMPLVWIFIDEAHEFLPREGRTPATDALVQLLREGRQPGISIVLATQQPGKIHTDAITQSDIVLSHRVTAKLDVQALNDITQSYLYESISDKLNALPHLTGSAIILDDNSERIYPMRVRPRFTWHGGEAPTAIKKMDEEL